MWKHRYMFNSKSKNRNFSPIQKSGVSREHFQGVLRLGVEELWTFERTRRVAMLSVLRFEWEPALLRLSQDVVQVMIGKMSMARPRLLGTIKSRLRQNIVSHYE